VSPRRAAVGLVALVGATAVLATPAAAHAGSLALGSPAVSIPAWLFFGTGGGVVAASFLLTSLLTDRALLRSVHRRTAGLPSGPALLAAGRRLAGAAGVLGLLAVLLGGLFGPPDPVANLAILLVWAGWWAGYTMSVYLLGNTWPALDPWRTVARRLPSRDRDYPDRLGAWPAVAGLLGLVWVEVVSPVAESPRLLAVVVLGYTAVTLAGAWLYGDSWFRRVDPIAALFRWYGRMAPVQRTDDGLVLRLPGSALAERRAAGPDEVAFVVGLVWVTSFDGLVSTPAWRALAAPVVAAGVPGPAVYLVALVAGFGGFLAVYRGAARLVRATADTYVASGAIAERFAPSLVPIAAGYHLAHFSGYFLTLSPALAAALAGPLGGPPRVAVLPDWFGGVGLALVVLGHLLAVWVAHAVAFETFTGRLQPLRSQYPFVVVMVGYTVTSAWLLGQPYSAPPFL
jgi:hypothetical protein